MQFTDQLHRTITLKDYPQRIVSLVPSQSELLWDLGLQRELVGITKFCIHPDEMYRSIPRIGGTKTIDIDKIRALKPDLIIGNKEENEQSQVKTLMKEFTVWMSDIHNYPQALDMIGRIGQLTGKEQASEILLSDIKNGFSALTRSIHSSVLYLIWKNPYMAAGRNTFINDLLDRIGLENTAATLDGRYPEVSQEQIVALDPGYVFLSSEPYPFKQQHIEALQALIPRAKVLLVDGEMFSWYGSRMKKAPLYLRGLIEQLK